MQHWLHLTLQQIQETSFWEWVAVLFGIAEVVLAMMNKVWLYPAGIISTAITIYYLLAAQLYADSLLNLYYVVMSLYGWFYWVRKGNRPQVNITYSNRQDWIITLAISIGGWAVLYILLKAFTPSTVPVWDSLVSSTAWAGTWLLTRRKMENWIVLNTSNIFAIPLLFYKQLPMFALLTLVLFIIAFFGYYDWRKIYRQQVTATN